jgi:hypothetical protein
MQDVVQCRMPSSLSIVFSHVRMSHLQDATPDTIGQDAPMLLAAAANAPSSLQQVWPVRFNSEGSGDAEPMGGRGKFTCAMLCQMLIANACRLKGSLHMRPQS